MSHSLIFCTPYIFCSFVSITSVLATVRLVILNECRTELHLLMTNLAIADVLFVTSTAFGRLVDSYDWLEYQRVILCASLIVRLYVVLAMLWNSETLCEQPQSVLGQLWRSALIWLLGVACGMTAFSDKPRLSLFTAMISNNNRNNNNNNNDNNNETKNATFTILSAHQRPSFSTLIELCVPALMCIALVMYFGRWCVLKPGERDGNVFYEEIDQRKCSPTHVNRLRQLCDQLILSTSFVSVLSITPLAVFYIALFVCMGQCLGADQELLLQMCIECTQLLLTCARPGTYFVYHYRLQRFYMNTDTITSFTLPFNGEHMPNTSSRSRDQGTQMSRSVGSGSRTSNQLSVLDEQTSIDIKRIRNGSGHSVPASWGPRRFRCIELLRNFKSFSLDRSDSKTSMPLETSGNPQQRCVSLGRKQKLSDETTIHEKAVAAHRFVKNQYCSLKERRRRNKASFRVLSVRRVSKPSEWLSLGCPPTIHRQASVRHVHVDATLPLVLVPLKKQRSMRENVGEPRNNNKSAKPQISKTLSSPMSLNNRQSLHKSFVLLDRKSDKRKRHSSSHSSSSVVPVIVVTQAAVQTDQPSLLDIL